MILNTDRHIIGKVILDINAISETEAYWLKDHVASLLNDQVFSGMEKMFSDVGADDGITRLERIDLDISIENWDNPDALRIEIENQLRQKIAFAAIEKRYPLNGEPNRTNGIPEYQTNTISGERNLQNIFLFFLKEGYLPWYGQKSDVDQLLSDTEWPRSIKKERFIIELKKLLKSDDTVFQRFVLQIPIRNCMQFINLLEQFEWHNDPGWSSLFKSLSNQLKKQFISVLLKISLQEPQATWKTDLIRFHASYLSENRSHESLEDQIHQLGNKLKNISRHTNLVLTQKDFYKVSDLIKQNARIQFAKEGRTKQKERKIENDPTIISQRNNFTTEKEPLFFEKDAGEIAVQNAGQVLFYPFLKMFFERFNWLDEAGKIKKDQRFKAVHAIHYCATANDQFFEGDLVLEKFLCDVPLKTPLPASSLLNEAIKEEADNMLRELIKNWPALKNTSPDGLRELFVNRSGKLIQKDRNFKLIVERKTQDILLEKLQWSISIIKLPWKKELIFVEW